MRVIYLAIAATLMAAPAAFASSAYTCTTFQQDGAASTVATGINNKGQVVGVWYDSQGSSHAFLREADGTMRTLRSPTGSDDFTPVGINNLGQIAAQTFIINADGSYTEIAPPVAPPGRTYYTDPEITGINDKGELSGSIDGDPSTGATITIYIFIRGAHGKYRIVDQSVSGSGPSLFAGPLNNKDAVIVHSRYSDGSLVNADGPSTPLTFPGIPYQSRSPGGATQTQGLNNSGATAGSIFGPALALPYFSFTRTLNGHYPAVVCPDMPNAGLGVGGMNDKDVVAASANGLGVIATPTGIYPHVKLSNQSWNFAPHPVGETSGSGTIYISNSGPADLHIRGVYIGNTDEVTVAPGEVPDQGRLWINQTNCATLVLPDATPGLPSIPPGGWCFVNFTLTPQVTGWQTSRIYIVSDAADSPAIIRVGVEGIGVASRLQLSNSSWTFAAHPVGETSGNGVIYVYNSGPKSVTFAGTQIVAGTGGASNFALTGNTCGSSLSPYKTCALTFNFTPTSPGEHTASLNVNDDSEGGPLTIPIYGNGLPTAQ